VFKTQYDILYTLYRAHVEDETLNHTRKNILKLLQDTKKFFRNNLCSQQSWYKFKTAQQNIIRKKVDCGLHGRDLARECRTASSPCRHIFIFRQYLTPVPSNLQPSAGLPALQATGTLTNSSLIRSHTNTYLPLLSLLRQRTRNSNRGECLCAITHVTKGKNYYLSINS
jgi:hypothetical protein